MPNNLNNQNFATATEILTVSAGTVIKKGELSATDTVDWYKFTTASASNVNISLTDLTGNATVRLGKLNAAGTAIIDEIPISDNSGKLSESLIKTSATGALVAGTYYIEVARSGSATEANYTLSTFASADTNYSSLLWRNEALRTAATWQLQGKDYGDARFLPGGTDANGDPIPNIDLPSNYYIAGTGDLNGDGAEDLVWRDRNDGSVFTWMMDGKTILKKADGSYDAAIVKIADVTLSIPENWIIAGVADMDGDFKADILWRNLTEGTTYAWRMDGTNISSTKQIDAPLSVSSDWEVAGLSDTNKDSKADLLWRQKSTGVVAIWLLDANNANGLATVAAPQKITAPIDLNYKIVAFTDMTGDGKADLVWRNASAGKIAFWEIDGAEIATLPGGGYTAATREVPFTIPADYFIAGVADFDGDKKGDLIWRNNNDGFVGIWLSDLTSQTGFKLQREFAVADANGVETGLSPSGQYTIEAVKDFNGDGKADIFWRNISAGETGVWTIKSFPTANGKILLDLAQTGFIPIGAGADYSIKGVLNTKFARKAQTLTTGDATTAFNLGIAEGTGNYLESVSGTSKDLYKFKLTRNTAITLALLNPTNLNGPPQAGVTRILRKEGANGVFVEVQGFVDGNTLEGGVYQIEVASAGGTAVTPYNLRVSGVPLAIDLVGKVFTAPTTVIDLTDNTDLDPLKKDKKTQVSVNYTIENTQPSNSGPVKVKFYISRDDVIDPTQDRLVQVVQNVNGTLTLLDETTVSNVPGSDPNTNVPGTNGTATAILELPLATDLFWPADGSYHIGMVIDPVSAAKPTGDVDEVGERVNNVPTNAISNNYNQAIGKDKAAITVAKTLTPNLQVTALTPASTVLTRTSTNISVAYTVRNDGKRSSEDPVTGDKLVALGLYISDKDNLSFDDLKSNSEEVFLDNINNSQAILGSTNVSGQATFSLAQISSTFWAERPGSTFYLYAFVDPNSSIGEGGVNGGGGESDNVLKAVTPLTITA
jgi:Bacterial pre-peptidase C-terminal domain